MKRYLLSACAALIVAFQAHAAAPRLDMTVPPQWLAAHLNDPHLVILHLGRKEEYEERHIPGARFIRLSDIAVDRDELTLQLPDSADLKRRLGAFGIDDASQVVVYFGKDWVSPATRVIFTLFAAGLGDRVALLDGGMDAWMGAGNPVTQVVPPRHGGPGPAIALRPVVVDADFVRSHAHAPGYLLIDARAPVYYDGIQPSGDMRKLRKGHIPGAVNLPFTSVADLANRIKPKAELEALFRAAGATPDTHVIVYCHIGQQATAVLFAARMVGLDAVLYDGSFEDWTWHDGPVEARATQ